MEEKEVEISSEELQNWITDGVHKASLTTPGILKKCRLLKALLEKRQRRATRFLELCQSVVVFENTVKELYSHLGWEYTELDSDSDDDNETMSCRRTLPFLFVSSRGSIPRPSSSPVKTHQASSPENQEEMNHKKTSTVILNKKAKVILTRLRSSEIAFTNPPASRDSDGDEDDDFISDASFVEWKPVGEMSDSESSDPDFGFGFQKKRKIKTKKGKNEKLNPASKRRRQSATKARKENIPASTPNKIPYSVSDPIESPILLETSDTDNESSQQEATARRSGFTKTTKCLSSKKTETSQNHGKTAGNVMKTFMPSVKDKVTVGTPVSEGTSKTNTITRIEPEGEIKVNMNVLARKKHMCWQRGKVSEIITRENGKVKYKINFTEKGKVLVSGHHLAFDGLPWLDDLSLGCRVVVKCPNETFQPGIMSELPNRKNRMRFLVYIDDHTPMYVGLREIYLVCRPLADPLDDISDDNHRIFMQRYLKLWPYLPFVQLTVGQTIKAEYEGMMQTCKVITVDCSLVEVIFESDQHKEWLYRGSLRLEHLLNMNSLKKQAN